MAFQNQARLQRSECEGILSEEEVGYLALASDGQPYCVPVSYALIDSRIVIHCALEGHKLDVIRSNPRCCFTVSRSGDRARPHQAEGNCDYRFESVVASGRATIIEDLEERFSWLQRFKDHFYARLGLDPNADPVTEAAVAKCACIVIELEELSGRRRD